MKKALSIFFVSVLFISALSGCGGGGTNTTTNNDDDTAGTTAGGETIKFGIFEPFTGQNAAGAELEYRGIQVAKEYLGPLLGKEVVLVQGDNKSDAVEAATVAERLVTSDKVDIVIGSYGSNLAIPGGDKFKAAQTVAIGASCTNPNVTLGNDYYYRVCFLDPFQGTVLANYAANTLKATKVAIIYEVTNDYAVGLRNFFKQTYESLGGTIVADLTYQANDVEFSAQIANVMSFQPDVIFAPGNYTEAALIMQQTRAAGHADVKFLGGDTWEVPTLIEVGKEAVEGCGISSFFDAAAPINAMTTTFVDLYRAKYNEDPAAFAALGFDAYLTAYKAIEAAGSTESDAIRTALSTLSVEGCTGTLKFDENGDAIKNTAVLKTVKDGAFAYLDTVTIQ